MLNKWIQIVKTTDVEPGETIRQGRDANSDYVQEGIVSEVMESSIVLTDGSFILKSSLSFGIYWHKFKQSAW